MRVRRSYQLGVTASALALVIGIGYAAFAQSPTVDRAATKATTMTPRRP